MARRRKTSDRDIKEFFYDYSKARGRRKILLNKSIGREMTAEEKDEYVNLGLFIDTVDSMIDTLYPLIAKIVRDYYIKHDNLFTISLDINYCYEHVSYLKNIGCDTLRLLLKGEDIIKDECSINIMNIIETTVKSQF